MGEELTMVSETAMIDIRIRHLADFVFNRAQLPIYNRILFTEPCGLVRAQTAVPDPPTFACLLTRPQGFVFKRRDMETLTIKIKGICQPLNPGGHMCYAWIAYDEADRAVAKDAACSPRVWTNTNNQAEYIALKHALLWASSRGYKYVRVLTNSRLVANQIAGEWECNSPLLQMELAGVQEVARHFLSFDCEWIAKTADYEPNEMALFAYEHRHDAGMLAGMRDL